MLVVMSPPSNDRYVVVLAPMPLEMNATIAAFGLRPSDDAGEGCWSGRVGSSDVIAVHTGMGPALTREVLRRMFDEEERTIDHVMVAGICGGLSPEIDVGTLINPEFVIDYSTGTAYRHFPPGGGTPKGTLMTTESVTLNPALSERFLAEGCIAVDMETAAVAEVCEEHARPWSAYRCIGDRYFDGLLDARIVGLTEEDGSGKMDEIERLVASDPELGAKLSRLGRDTSRAAKIASEAAAAACLALYP
jgi:adenosylhomocysteine nucleosidase